MQIYQNSDKKMFGTSRFRNITPPSPHQGQKIKINYWKKKRKIAVSIKSQDKVSGIKKITKISRLCLRASKIDIVR